VRLGARIAVFVAGVAVVPPLIVATVVADVAGRSVSDAVLRSEVATAQAVAAIVGRQMDDAERLLRLQVGTYRLDVAPDAARQAFVLATYRILPEIGIAALLDAAGEELVPPVYQSAGQSALDGHDAIDEVRLARFRSQVPVAGGAGEVVVGRAYVPDGALAAVVPLLATSPYGDGASLAVELSLASIGDRLSAGEGRAVMVLDAEGVALVRSGTQSLVDAARLRPLLAAPSADIRYTTPEGIDVLAATARVPGRDWAVVVAEPGTAVVEAVRGVRHRAAYIAVVAVAFAVVAGRLFAGGITGPIQRVRDAALAVGGGDYSRRVGVDGVDVVELTELASSFDRMSESLARSRHELAEKNAQIAAFADELQERVEQRTAQLREAQARLVQSGQLAAVAQLSAGLAHELNNPLAGVMGAIQIARARTVSAADAALLDAAEREAARCRDIVANLLRLADEPGSDDDAGSDPERVLTDVLAFAGAALRERGLRVERCPVGTGLDGVRSPRVWAPIGRARLGRAFGQLLAAVRSVAAPGALRVESVVDGRVLRVHLVLEAARSGEDDWRACGLGLWVARAVFDGLGARLEGPGTAAESWPPRWTVDVPLGEAPCAA
jgi:signal transduction histidine kinase